MEPAVQSGGQDCGGPKPGHAPGEPPDRAEGRAVGAVADGAPATPAAPSGPPVRRFTPWPEQDENGVDLTLIRANLRLSPEQRLRRAAAARRSALRVQQIGREARAKQAGAKAGALAAEPPGAARTSPG